MCHNPEPVQVWRDKPGGKIIAYVDGRGQLHVYNGMSDQMERIAGPSELPEAAERAEEIGSRFPGLDSVINTGRDTPRSREEASIVGAVGRILSALGEDVSREGLRNTPLRVARFYTDWLLNYDPGNIDVTFESVQVDQLVVVKNITGYSLCEHHILPFWFKAHVGYITGEKVIGLSKIPRIVQKHAHKLQLQERLTNDIANELMDLTKARGVGVVITGVHLCAVMRGVRASGASMVTSSLLGVMIANPHAKDEFLALAGIK
jgi:GTP cyclohydrolase I